MILNENEERSSSSCDPESLYAAARFLQATYAEGSPENNDERLDAFKRTLFSGVSQIDGRIPRGSI